MYYTFFVTSPGKVTMSLSNSKSSQLYATKSARRTTLENTSIFDFFDDQIEGIREDDHGMVLF